MEHEDPDIKIAARSVIESGRSNVNRHENDQAIKNNKNVEFELLSESLKSENQESEVYTSIGLIGGVVCLISLCVISFRILRSVKNS